MSFRVSEVFKAEREAELEKQVLSSHPDLIGRLEEGKKTLEKDTQERYKLTNRWFDMSWRRVSKISVAFYQCKRVTSLTNNYSRIKWNEVISPKFTGYYNSKFRSLDSGR